MLVIKYNTFFTKVSSYFLKQTPRTFIIIANFREEFCFTLRNTNKLVILVDVSLEAKCSSLSANVIFRATTKHKNVKLFS